MSCVIGSQKSQHIRAQASHPLAKIQHVRLCCEHAGFCCKGWNCLWALVSIHPAPLCVLLTHVWKRALKLANHLFYRVEYLFYHHCHTQPSTYPALVYPKHTGPVYQNFFHLPNSLMVSRKRGSCFEPVTTTSGWLCINTKRTDKTLKQK